MLRTYKFIGLPEESPQKSRYVTRVIGYERDLSGPFLVTNEDSLPCTIDGVVYLFLISSDVIMNADTDIFFYKGIIFDVSHFD